MIGGSSGADATPAYPSNNPNDVADAVPAYSTHDPNVQPELNGTGQNNAQTTEPVHAYFSSGGGKMVDDYEESKEQVKQMQQRAQVFIEAHGGNHLVVTSLNFCDQ